MDHFMRGRKGDGGARMMRELARTFKAPLNKRCRALADGVLVVPVAQ